MNTDDELTDLLNTASRAVGDPQVDATALISRARRAQYRRSMALAAIVILIGLMGVTIPLLAAGREHDVNVAARGDVDFEPGWTQLPRPPLTPRTGATSARTGDEVVVAGGWTFTCPGNGDCGSLGHPALADGAAFNLRTQTWRSIARSPVPFTTSFATVVDGDVYLIPCDQPTCEGSRGMLRYRPAADVWVALPGPPSPARYTLGPLSGALLAYSISDERGEAPDWRFDLQAGAWAELPDDPMPPTFDRQMVAVGDGLFLFAKPISALKSGSPGRVIGARLDLTTGLWGELTPAPVEGYQVWVLDRRVVLGPSHGVAAGGGVFDPASGSWTAFPTPPDDARGHFAGALGKSTAAFNSGEGWVFDLASGRWLEIPELHERQRFPETSVTSIGRSLFVFGGDRWETNAKGELLNDAWVWTPPR